MKRIGIVLIVISALLVGVASPGRTAQVSAASGHSKVAAARTPSHAAAFNRARFILHLAAAAFLIHYIYKKYKQHKLGRFHIFTDIKAAAAGLIAYHELKEAYNAAKTSKSATLHALIAPITLVLNGINTAVSKLKHGDTSSLTSLNSQEGKFASVATKYGFHFTDRAPSGFGGF